MERLAVNPLSRWVLVKFGIGVDQLLRKIPFALSLSKGEAVHGSTRSP